MRALASWHVGTHQSSYHLSLCPSGPSLKLQSHQTWCLGLGLHTTTGFTKPCEHFHRCTRKTRAAQTSQKTWVTYTQCHRFLLLCGWASQTLWRSCSSRTGKQNNRLAPICTAVLHFSQQNNKHVQRRASEWVTVTQNGSTCSDKCMCTLSNKRWLWVGGGNWARTSGELNRTGSVRQKA